jgi:aldose 1-epimerase
MVSDGLLTLSAGPLDLTLNPAVGGSILAFDHVADGVRTPVLRGRAGAVDDVLAAASFPLVPFVNRIRGGTFDFRGRRVTLAPNMSGDPSPLHGQGWRGSWQVVEHGRCGATLQFDHRAGEWPWRYVAQQHFMLDPAGLEVVLECTNLSPDPMPCGLGQHPYFHCTPATRIRTDVTHVWTVDDCVLPVDMVPAAGRFDLADTGVCGLGLDHGFGGWGGAARLTDPAWPFAIAMTSPDAAFFQLYSPATGGIFVAEPVSHANAALNAPEAEWAELGLCVLDPGERMALTMRIALS